MPTKEMFDMMNQNLAVVLAACFTILAVAVLGAVLKRGIAGPANGSGPVTLAALQKQLAEFILEVRAFFVESREDRQKLHEAIARQDAVCEERHPEVRRRRPAEGD